VAFLFEHKSYYPTEMPIQLQLLRYMLALWEHHLKQQLPLVPIIPIVLYHGKRQWEQKPLAHFFGEQLGLLLEGQLARFLPGFDYILADLSAYPDEEIKTLFSLVALQTALLIMKKIFDKTLAEEIQKIGDAFNELLETKSGEKFYRTILLYLYNGTTIDKQVIIMNMQKVSTKAGALAQSAAEQLRKEGKEEKEVQLIENMILSQLLSYEQIAAIAGVERAWVEKIAQQIKEKS
ncbi:MAG: Rpn family recombination-promoting nuclease/putative transposase, partial [Bacteroidota bacterium]